MPAIEVRSQVSLDELLNGVAQLDTREFEHFVSQVLFLRARRVAPSLAKEEAGLLEIVNQGLSPALQQRYDELTAKRRAESLTSEEHRELLELIDRVERGDAERVRALTGLAQLRKITVKELMDELGIRPPAYA
ncbi:MAG: STAS/SEC14 domain-containing protein [bacterium]|nr:STAS/SEC14 domain-containing protein [bacterium]